MVYKPQLLDSQRQAHQIHTLLSHNMLLIYVNTIYLPSHINCLLSHINIVAAKIYLFCI